MAADNNNDSDKAKEMPCLSESSMVNKRLKSYPGSDLDVVVGASQRVYRHNGFILANYSAYVDTMLASSFKEHKTKRISFPEIEPETWEKMIAYMEPDLQGRKLNTKDILEILPLYDKYQFEDGVKRLDPILKDIISGTGYSYKYYDGEDEEVALVVMCFNLGLHKNLAIKYASDALSMCKIWDNPDHVRALLPIVENEDKVLVSMVKNLKGRHVCGMTLEEIRAVTREETFPQQCKDRRKQIKEIDDLLRSFKVGNYSREEYVDVKVISNDRVEVDDIIKGKYFLEQRASIRVDFEPGVMSCSYIQQIHSSDQHRSRVEPMDVFGNIWEIVVYDYDEDNEAMPENKSSRRVLFRWDSGYSSLYPPKSGWKAVDEELLGRDQEISIEYTIGSY